MGVFKGLVDGLTGRDQRKAAREAERMRNEERRRAQEQERKFQQQQDEQRKRNEALLAEQQARQTATETQAKLEQDAMANAVDDTTEIQLGEAGESPAKRKRKPKSSLQSALNV